MKITTTHLLMGVALAAVVVLAKVRPTTPTTSTNRASQARADDYRNRLWREAPPDFYV
jgi:hypothetical protein